MSDTVYNIIQIVLSALLVIIILLQQKGAAVGGIFGGSSNIYTTKRGIDKILFYTTIGLSLVFFGFSLARLML